MGIRILHLLKSLDIGGAERSTIEYTNSLIDHFEFAGIAAKEGFYQKEGLIDKRIDVFNLSPPNLWNLFSHINYFIKIKKIITSNKINILHFHQRIHFIVVWLIKLFVRNIKVVYTHHNNFNDVGNIFLPADKVIAVSKTAKANLPERLKRKAIVIYHGVKPQKFKKRLNDSFTFGFVGRFIKGKGLNKNLELFKFILNENIQCKCIFIGEGDYKSELENKIENLSFKNFIEIKNPKRNLKDIYKDIDVLVNLSEKEDAFGMVLIEAMSFGIPVIASNLKCFNEIVEHKKNGFIISNDDETNINELLKFINDKDSLQSFSIQAINTVINKFNIDSTTKLYKKFYTDLSLV